MRAGVIAVLLLVGCAQTGADQVVCKQRAAEVRAHLAASYQAASGVDGLYPELDLPTISGTSDHSHMLASQLAFSHGRVTLDQRDLGPIDTAASALGADLRTLEKHWSAMHKPPATGPTMDLFVDRDTPIAQLAPLLQAAEPGTRVQLIVRPLSAPAPMAVPPSLVAFQRAMTAAWRSAEERTMVLNQAFASATDGCPSLRKRLFDAAQRGEPDSTVPDNVQQGLLECACKVPELANLEFVVASGWGGGQVRRTSMPFPLQRMNALIASGRGSTELQSLVD